MGQFCKNCGLKLDVDSKFCDRCRAVVAGHDQPASSVATPNSTPQKNLTGLTGWLILPALGLLYQPLHLIYAIFSVNLPFFYNSNYQNTIAQYPTLRSLGVYELLVNIAFLAALIYLNILFYKKKKVLPRYFIGYYIINFALLLIDYLILVTVVPSTSGSGLWQTGIAALIWIPYFLKSRRVKETFIQ
jgi:hypothetical protein